MMNHSHLGVLMEIVSNVPVLVGETVAGESAKVRKQLEEKIIQSNQSLFDIGELAYTVEHNGYYEGYTTFAQYLEELSTKTNFKKRRLRYLTRIAKVMNLMGIPRDTYEPVGVSKLRAITSLDPDGIWTNPVTKEEVPITEFITGFIEKHETMTEDEIQKHVQTLKGFVGEDSMGWVHLYMKQIVIDKVVKPALEKARMVIGSVGKDGEGNSQDASDGRAAEVIFVSFQNEELGE